MMQKSSLSNFCLTNVSNLKVFLEIHGSDIAFAKSEHSYRLTSTDADGSCSKTAHATSQEETFNRVILQYMHICVMALNPYLIMRLTP